MLGSCQNPQAATGPHQAVLALPPTEAVCLGTGLERSSAKTTSLGGGWQNFTSRCKLQSSAGTLMWQLHTPTSAGWDGTPLTFMPARWTAI